MADTTTTNLALLIADLNDTFDFGAHVEANFTTIDGLMGLVKCTSSTRPSNTYGGQGIYETDTKRVMVNTGTKGSPVWTCVIYSNFVCTSSTHPSGPFQGLEIYETDTGASAIYTGSGYSYSMQQIATTKLVGTTASVTFSSIPAYTALKCVWSGRSDGANTAFNVYLRFNGDSGNNYLWENAQALNATVGGNTGGGATAQIVAGVCAGNTATANYFGTGQFTVGGMSSGVFKPVSGTSVTPFNTTNIYSGAYGGAWLSTSAITSLTLLPATGNWVSGSWFTLYGMM